MNNVRLQAISFSYRIVLHSDIVTGMNASAVRYRQYGETMVRTSLKDKLSPLRSTFDEIEVDIVLLLNLNRLVLRTTYR